MIMWFKWNVFIFTGLAVGFDGSLLNAAEAVNFLTVLVESLMTRWLTDNWLSDCLRVSDFLCQ